MAATLIGRRSDVGSLPLKPMGVLQIRLRLAKHKLWCNADNALEHVLNLVKLQGLGRRHFDAKMSDSYFAKRLKKEVRQNLGGDPR